MAASARTGSTTLDRIRTDVRIRGGWGGERKVGGEPTRADDQVQEDAERARDAAARDGRAHVRGCPGEASRAALAGLAANLDATDASPGTSPGTPPGASPGASPGTPPGTPPGASPGSWP